jgi:hypothetical protein
MRSIFGAAAATASFNFAVLSSINFKVAASGVFAFGGSYFCENAGAATTRRIIK